METEKIFNALPHVNSIWVTKDGHFHLHPNNGGEKFDREETAPIVKSAKELIELINAAESVEEINEIIGLDERKTVKDAAEKKIASLTS